jgi:hypothetical protein
VLFGAPAMQDAAMGLIALVTKGTVEECWIAVMEVAEVTVADVLMDAGG